MGILACKENGSSDDRSKISVSDFEIFAWDLLRGIQSGFGEY